MFTTKTFLHEINIQIRSFCSPDHSSVTRISPAFTDVPFMAWIDATFPAAGAAISFSIFIASSITRISPCATCCPASTLISSTVPGTGALTPVPPSGTAAPADAVPPADADTAVGAADPAEAGCGDGADVPACAVCDDSSDADAAFVAAAFVSCTGAAGAGDVSDVFFTSYVVPFTVILYFFICPVSFRFIRTSCSLYSLLWLQWTTAVYPQTVS